MTQSLFSPSSRWAASKVTAKIENTCIISVWKATVQHVWVVRCGIMCGHRLSWFLSRRTQISIFVCDVLDYQRPFTLQRFSQARVWLPLEEFQPCEEINGEQSKTALVYLYCCYPGRSHKKKKHIFKSYRRCTSDCSDPHPLHLQLHGRKQHIRALLIDRVMLQHEVSHS